MYWISQIYKDNSPIDSGYKDAVSQVNHVWFVAKFDHWTIDKFAVLESYQKPNLYWEFNIPWFHCDQYQVLFS